MSILEENYNYLINIVLSPLGILESDFPNLKKNIKKGKPNFNCTKKVAREKYALRFDFKFERNADRPSDLKYYLNEVRAILRPNEGDVSHLMNFKLFRQKGKSIEEMESDVCRLRTEKENINRNTASCQVPEMAKKLVSKKHNPATKTSLKRKKL